MEIVITCLNHVPALELLELRVIVGSGMDEDDEEYEENPFDWNNFVPPPVTHFPQLKSLNQMIVSVKQLYDYDAIPPKNFFSPIFAAYGSQISKLTCEPTVLYQVDGSSFLNLYFSNLQELVVFGASNENLWANLGHI